MFDMFLIAFVVCSLAFTLYYIYGGHSAPFVRCRLKMISSLCFVCFGAFSYVYGYTSIYFIMLLALGLGMLGDVLLDCAVCYPERKQIFFLSGLTSFLLGHIAYVICFMNHMHWGLEILVCLVSAYIMLAFLRYQGCDFQEATIPVFAYSAVIVWMVLQTGKLLYFTPSTYALVVFTAAVLFALSDVVLSFLLFQDRYHRPSVTWLNLTTYYAAQWLLAGSLYILL